MDKVPDRPAELAAIEPGSIIFGVDTKVTSYKQRSKSSAVAAPGERQ